MTLSKRLFVLAFLIGLVAVGWVAVGFVGSSALALAMTAVIGAVYVLGTFELLRFRAGSAALAAGLSTIPQPLPSLQAWLDTLPAGLRQPVRLRVEAGERGALPGPALAPYLVGLLVMLGMLGTFIGMVVTFKGAVFALEGSADLQAMRTALAEPIKGLGLAFGTSVAGVAASSMLGLMSALCRRERLALARQLDGHIATVLKPFSLLHQRQETFRLLQAQGDALPQVADKLDAMMERIERRSQQLEEQLLARQAGFHDDAKLAYTGLANQVGASLQDSVAAGARAAGETITPLITKAMADIVLHSQQLHDRVGEAAREQVDSFTTSFEQRSTTLLAAVEAQVTRSGTERALAEQERLQAWSNALQATTDRLQAHWQHAGDQTIAHQQAVCASLERTAGDVAERASEQAVRTLGAVAQLVARSEDLVQARTDSEQQWLGEHGRRMEQMADTWRAELAVLRQEETARGQAAVERLGELQAAVAQHLCELGTALEAPITRLLQTASEVPEAAADVLSQLRREMTAVAERDNLALQERTVLLERLGALMQTVNQASVDQREATQGLLASAASVLEQAGTSHAQALETQAGTAAEVAAQLTGSAVELASLGDAFGHGVERFQATSEKLMEGLQRIEVSLNRSTARSDEQLAYYVAQAREVIDLSISSQQGMVENLRQFQAKPIAVLPGSRG